VAVASAAVASGEASAAVASGEASAAVASGEASAAVASGEASAAVAPVAWDEKDDILEPQAATKTDDVDLRLHAVLAVAVIVAIVLLLVITGQVHAASSSSPAQGI
jgi:hypothetical protein